MCVTAHGCAPLQLCHSANVHVIAYGQDDGYLRKRPLALLPQKSGTFTLLDIGQ